MSDQNGFFRFVWRFNGIVIMLLLLAALVCAGYHVATHRGMMRMHDTRFAHMGQDFGPPEGYSLTPLNGLFSGVTKAERLYSLDKVIPGKRPHGFQPFAAPTDFVSVNILALNDKAKASRWLFKHADRVILSQTLLYAFGANTPVKDDETAAAAFAGVAIVVAETDTNKDGRIAADDAQSLYFYAMDGKAPAKVLDADRIVVVPYTFGMKQFELFYQKGGKSFAAVYSLPKFELVSEIPISGLPSLSRVGGTEYKVGFITEPRSD